MNLKNSRGSVLMLVVIFSLIMCLLGMAVIYMNGLEFLAVRRDMMDEKATYAAEGGLELGREFLYFCDARLEKSGADIDLDVTFGPGSTKSKEIWQAMDISTAHWGNVKDNYRILGGPVVLDSFPPAASCEVWISSANNNLINDGIYEYRITARGRASFEFSGGVDTVVDQSMVIQISSMTNENTSSPVVDAWPECMNPECGGWGKKHLPEALPMPAKKGGYTRYYFKYFRDPDSGKCRHNKPPVGEKL